MNHLVTALLQFQQDWLNRAVHAKVRDMKKQYLHAGVLFEKDVPSCIPEIVLQLLVVIDCFSRGL